MSPDAPGSDVDPGPGVELVPCVGAVVLDPAGALLLVLRRHPPQAGRWSLPGGRVEPGEDDAAAVAREVAEETGLAVAVGRLVGTVRRDAPDGRVFDIRDHLAAPVAGGPRPTVRAGDDAGDARWVDRAAYLAMEAGGELVDGLTAALSAWDCLPR